MNKLLILVLAICLVSVHAFVKRDAPAAANNGDSIFKDVPDKLKQLGEGMEKALKDLVDPDKMKAAFDQTIAGVNDVFANINKKEEPKA